MNLLDQLQNREPTVLRMRDQDGNEFIGHLAIIDKAHLQALVEVAREALGPMDIGDEINRCRLCWDAWGKHSPTCPLWPFLEEAS